MASLGDLVVTVGANIDGFQTAMADVSTTLSRVERDATRSLAGFDKLGSQLTTIGTGLTASITVPLVGVGAAALKVAGDLEQARVAFTTMLGSTGASSQFLDRLQQFAARTPFEFPDLVIASKRMMALGFAAKDVLPTLETVGNAAAALGGGAESINRITLALGQMQAKGKVSAEEMRQLAEAGIPAWQMLAEKIGVSIPQAMKMAEQGLISAQVALPALMEGMNARFAGLMEKQSKTITGMWSNVKDQVTFTLASIGEELAPSAKKIMESMIGALGTVKDLAHAFNELPQPIKDATIAIAATAAVIGPLTLGLGLLIKGITSTVTAFTVLSGVMGTVVLPAIRSVITAIQMDMVGALTTGELMLLRFGQAALVVSAGFAAWQLGSWLRNNVPVMREFGDAIGDWILKIPGLDALIMRMASIKDVVQPSKDLAAQVRDVVAALKAQGVVVEEQGSRTLVQYAKYLSDVKRAHGDYHEAVKKSTNITVSLEDQLKKAESTLGDVKKAFDMGAASAQDLEKAQRNVLDITARLHPEYKSLFEAVDNGLPSIRSMALHMAESMEVTLRAKDAMAAYAEEIGVTVEQLGISIRSYPELIDSIVRESESLAEEALNVERSSDKHKELTDVLKQQDQTFKDIGKTVKDLEKPFKDLGIQSQATLQETARKAKEAFNQIKADGNSTALDIQRAWLRMVEAQMAAGEQLPKATREQYEKIKQQVGEVTGHTKAKWYEVSTQVSTIITDMGRQVSRSLIDIVKGTTSVGDAFKKIFESAGEALTRFVSEKLVGMLFKELDHLATKILPGVLDKLAGLFGMGGGSGGGGVLGTTVGAAGGAAGTIGKAAGGIGQAGGSVGSAAGSIAGSTATGLVGAVAGVVSAVSDVIANFQLARQEGTLNAIEQHTKVLAIGLVGISTPWEKQAKGQISIFDVLNQYLPKIGELGDNIRDRLSPYFLDISGKLNALVVGTMTALLGVGEGVKDGATTTAAAIATALSTATTTAAASMESGLLTVRDKLVDLRQAVIDSTASQTRQLENALGTLADNIYKSLNPLGMVGTILGAIGGGLGSLGSNLGGIASGIAGGLGGAVTAVFDQRQESTLNAIEQHTKVMAIVMAGISAPWEKVADGQDTMFEKFGQIRNALVEKLPWIVDFTHQAASALKDQIQPNIALMTESLKSIDSKVFAKESSIGSGSTTQNITINVNGAQDPQATAKAVMDLLKSQSPVFV